MHKAKIASLSARIAVIASKISRLSLYDPAYNAKLAKLRRELDLVNADLEKVSGAKPD
jgi:hypothetical protein